MTSLRGFRCGDCGTETDEAAPTRCPECSGWLDATYDYDDVAVTGEALADREGGWKHRELLPFVPGERAESGEKRGTSGGAPGVLGEGTSGVMGEGTTPLVGAPRLADELGVERVLVKDEAYNPTGSVTDRGLALVTEAALRDGADTLALPTTGDGGQSAAAYAARAGLLSRAFVPSRTAFVNKAMINVHGGDMRVVEGRFDDAREAYEHKREELPAADAEAWFPAAAFDSPFRHEGVKPVYFEVLENLGWTVPDAVVVPVGHGATVAGLWKAAREAVEVGLVDGGEGAATPRFFAAQPDGCAPIVEALEAGGDPERWAVPDTVVGRLEVPDPAGGRPAARAVRESGGAGVAVDDQDLLDSAATVAQHEGLEVSVACGAAAAAAWELAEDGGFDGDETVVLLNTGSGNKDADVVRSRLMGRGM